MLVNPPFYSIQGSHYNGISLGLSYIAASLNAAGHDAWVYNADYRKSSEYKTLYQVYKTFNEYISEFRNPNSAPVRLAVQAICNFVPDWIGYSAYTPNMPIVRHISSAVRAVMPNVRQVVGGVHPTLDPATLSGLPDIDYAIRGEGEYAMRNLIESGSRDRVIRADRIASLDDLPWPEREKFWSHGGIPMSQEEKLLADVSYISTARGCPYSCKFCASPVMWGRVPVAKRKASGIIGEVRHICDSHWRNSRLSCDATASDRLTIHDNTAIYFVDDTFVFNEQIALNVMEGIAEVGNVPWKCESRADRITEPIASAMATSGCTRAKIGVESGSDRMLAKIGKKETKADILRGVRLLQKHGVPVTAYLMAGFPDETNDDLRKTIDFARELDVDYYSISILSPYYGTEIYRQMVDSGSGIDRQPWEFFYHHNRKPFVNDQLSPALLDELWALCDTRKYA